MLFRSTKSGTTPLSHIARTDGHSFTALGRGLDDRPLALSVFDGELYAGGNFTMAGGQIAGRLAKWNGTTWTPTGSGMNGTVGCFCAFDDGLGGGPALYAGGQFSSAIGVPGTIHIAKWNGSVWSSVGGGVNDEVNTMTVFDDGSGPALFAGGQFTLAGNVSVMHIAKWNGTSWSAYGVLGANAPEIGRASCRERV